MIAVPIIDRNGSTASSDYWEALFRLTGAMAVGEC
ncbi:hypothetical protein QFZ36_002016 [Pseudarthrobacter siccitolerans]|uniref:Uncharacterized protein n=1 Tax=Pseudarthrobacter siccitolerans TaxID=861266 RepID=A0ABU0PKF5_9MICC|nr:hypothetical protein [Pseudarthrobacter siccitolerans]MDQ0689338.1 hypothetical protein [Arthrobacter sp. W4I7]